VSLSNSNSFHPTVLAGCTSVTDGQTEIDRIHTLQQSVLQY